MLFENFVKNFLIFLKYFFYRSLWEFFYISLTTTKGDRQKCFFCRSFRYAMIFFHYYCFSEKSSVCRCVCDLAYHIIPIMWCNLPQKRMLCWHTDHSEPRSNGGCYKKHQNLLFQERKTNHEKKNFSDPFGMHDGGIGVPHDGIRRG